MAKTKEVKVKYAYPSRFGSHSSMIVRQEGDVVVCEDEYGEYETTKDRIDSGLADPRRYVSSRLKLDKVKGEK